MATSADLNIKKSRALAFGPKHRSGRTIAAIVNSAANFWKHRDEWKLEGNQARREQTLEVGAGHAAEGREVGRRSCHGSPLGASCRVRRLIHAHLRPAASGHRRPGTCTLSLVNKAR